MLENVKGLLSHDGGRTFKTIITTLAELGYSVEWQVLNSKNFGVPQNRERVFIVGHLGGFGGRQIFPIAQNEQVYFGKAKTEEGRPQAEIGTTLKAAGNIKADDTFIIEDPVAPTLRASDCKNGDNQTAVAERVVIDDLYPGRIRTFKQAPTLRSGRSGIKVIEPPHKHGEIREYTDTVPTMQARWGTGGNNVPYVQRVPLKFLNRNQKNIEGDYSYTVDTSHTGGVKIGYKIRRLTPTECERLQGFPDGWTANVKDTHRYKTLGNAVTVNVISEIIKRLFHE